MPQGSSEKPPSPVDLSAGLFFRLFISYPMTYGEYAIRRGGSKADDETDLKGQVYLLSERIEQVWHDQAPGIL